MRVRPASALAGRAIRVLTAIFLINHGAPAGAVPVGSGRHWQLTIEGLQCDVADSIVAMVARIRYLGAAGLVEAPVMRVVDSDGRTVLPRSLAWKDGSKRLAALMSAGGIQNVDADSEGRMQFRFPLRDTAGDLRLEFGDLKSILLAKANLARATGVCVRMLTTGQVQAVRRARPSLGKGAAPRARVYRASYPCREAAGGAPRRIEAPHPPYPPEHVLVFGRGYLPNLREVELPTGKAAAQSYAYAGRDDLDDVEDAARRAVAADFPPYIGSARHYLFNWGFQRAAGGNELFSIGLYGLRSCTK
jgi:hypothetical protein